MMKLWHDTGNYAGDDMRDYFVLISKTRDSDALERSNYACALSEVGPLKGVRIGEFGHWACGWIKTIFIHKDAPQSTIDIGNAITKRLADYPILDEDGYWREREKVAHDTWKYASENEREEYLDRAHIKTRLRSYSRIMRLDDSGALFDLLSED